MASLRDSFSRLFNSQKDAVGLEIGTNALKVVELKSGNPPSLSALAMRPTPPGLIQDDQIIDPKGLAEELKALFDDAGISNRNVVTAVGNRQAITRNIHVPKMSTKELSEAIKWEAERYIPFPIDEVELDYYELDHFDEIEDGGQMEVVIAAARLDIITEQIELLKLAGINPGRNRY